MTTTTPDTMFPNEPELNAALEAMRMRKAMTALREAIKDSREDVEFYCRDGAVLSGHLSSLTRQQSAVTRDLARIMSDMEGDLWNPSTDPDTDPGSIMQSLADIVHDLATTQSR